MTRIKGNYKVYLQTTTSFNSKFSVKILYKTLSVSIKYTIRFPILRVHKSAKINICMKVINNVES